jgi:hypothetical protein
MFRIATYFLSIAVSGQLFASISNQYCDNDTNQYHIGLSGGSLQEEPLDNGAKVALTRRELNAGVITSSEKDHSMAFDFNYQYTIVSYDDPVQPMTNGHLHSLDFPVRWHREGKDYTLDYYLAPVISVSSNALKNPDLLDREALQLWTGMIYTKELSHESSWLLGFRSDYRFGPYHIYPVAGFCWRPNANWQLQLALPDFNISRFFSNGINIKLFAEPDGNKWYVFSKDTTSSSDFFYNAIVTGLSIEWRINSTVWLEFSAIRHSKQEFSFALEDGTAVEAGANSSTGISIGAGVLF